jgi:hypothetical protein
MGSQPEDSDAPEYIYDGFKIDGVPHEKFAASIQEEVELIGGCVTVSVWEGDPELGQARVVVAFPDHEHLAAYIWWYYTEGELEPEAIEEEVASIREI